MCVLYARFGSMIRPRTFAFMLVCVDVIVMSSG